MFLAFFTVLVFKPMVQIPEHMAVVANCTSGHCHRILHHHILTAQGVGWVGVSPNNILDEAVNVINFINAWPQVPVFQYSTWQNGKCHKTLCCTLKFDSVLRRSTCAIVSSHFFHWTQFDLKEWFSDKAQLFQLRYLAHIFLTMNKTRLLH